MDLADRMCTLLGTRTISLRDNSMKAWMDLRLLFEVACRKFMVFKWRDTFFRVSYGISHFAYQYLLSTLHHWSFERSLPKIR
ncbi:hypothetical protein ACFX13_011349 [Malus domestica]